MPLNSLDSFHSGPMGPQKNNLESQRLIILGYFKPIVVYFGVEWLIISRYKP